MSLFYKDPDETLDYYVDWATFLGADTIGVSQWIVPAGITQVSVSNTTTRATIWLSGGVLSQTYEVTNRITTAAGRVKDQSISVRIEAN